MAPPSAATTPTSVGTARRPSAVLARYGRSAATHLAEDREAGRTCLQPGAVAHQSARRLDELLCRSREPPVAPVCEPDRSGERGARDADRAQRAGRLDHEARHDRGSEAGGGETEDAVHLTALDREGRREAGRAEGRLGGSAEVVALAEHDERDLAEIGDGDGAARRERMSLRDRDDELLAEQRLRLQYVLPHRQDHERDVDRALL